MLPQQLEKHLIAHGEVKIRDAKASYAGQLKNSRCTYCEFIVIADLPLKYGSITLTSRYSDEWRTLLQCRNISIDIPIDLHMQKLQECERFWCRLHSSFKLSYAPRRRSIFPVPVLLNWKFVELIMMLLGVSCLMIWWASISQTLVQCYISWTTCGSTPHDNQEVHTEIHLLPIFQSKGNWRSRLTILW